MQLLPQLDRVRAEDLGLIPKSEARTERGEPLPLEDGRKLYETHCKRSRATGGVKGSTWKRYRTVFDKFVQFAPSKGISTWNAVTADTLDAYASHLEDNGYQHKTLVNELTTLKQAIKWMIEAGHLHGKQPIELKLRRAESVPHYCYRRAEVAAMLKLSAQGEQTAWLTWVITALACTGLRIAELASLRWADIDLESGMLRLTDETGAARGKDKRRELKSGRSRSFPIHPDLKAILGKIPRRGRYVFYGPRGGRLKPDTVRRVFIREVIEPLAKQFPTDEGERGFKDGRFHSFRHYFCSTCANSGVPERMVMDWLGHADIEMIRHYYHLHDEEARRRMNTINFLGSDSGRSAGEPEGQPEEEDAKPEHPDTREAG